MCISVYGYTHVYRHMYVYVNRHEYALEPLFVHVSPMPPLERPLGWSMFHVGLTAMAQWIAPKLNHLKP